jgi:dTDP-4-dehydrorhamnose reductase
MKPVTKQLLILGHSGQLATELRNLAWPDAWQVTSAGRATLDIADGAALESLIAELRPSVIVNAAAYTAVDRAESEPEEAWRLNALVPGILARLAREHGSRFVHVSTDYVFDGSLIGRGYREDDPTGPVSVYGASKLAGEAAILAEGGNSLILRTAWVYSPHGQNFVKTMMRLAAERPVVSVVADQRGCPTAAGDIAEAIRTLLDTEARGILHFVGGGETTWHGFAAAIFERLAPYGLRVPELRAISTPEYPTPARRPANSVLDCGRFEQLTGQARRPWPEALARCIAALVAADR